jgi:hypothetical protein
LGFAGFAKEIIDAYQVRPGIARARAECPVQIEVHFDGRIVLHNWAGKIISAGAFTIDEDCS